MNEFFKQALYTKIAKAEYVSFMIKARAEYQEFLKWCDEYNPDSWMSFDDFLEARADAERENLRDIQNQLAKADF